MVDDVDGATAAELATRAVVVVVAEVERRMIVHSIDDTLLD